LLCDLLNEKGGKRWINAAETADTTNYSKHTAT
jgi:hypothetical protein